MLVLVTGSRTWTDRDTVREVFRDLPSDFELVHGGARGLDTIAGEVYHELTGRDAIVVKPDYKRYFSKVAPLRRNVEMLEMLQERHRKNEDVLVIAFKDLNSATSGTNHCYQEALERDLPVRKIQKIAS